MTRRARCDARADVELFFQMIDIQNKYAVTVYRKTGGFQRRASCRRADLCASTGLDDARHVAFSFQLGNLERCPKFNGPDAPDRFSSPYLFDAGK